MFESKVSEQQINNYYSDLLGYLLFSEIKWLFDDFMWFRTVWQDKYVEVREAIQGGRDYHSVGSVERVDEVGEALLHLITEGKVYNYIFPRSAEDFMLSDFPLQAEGDRFGGPAYKCINFTLKGEDPRNDPRVRFCKDPKDLHYVRRTFSGDGDE